MSNNNNDTASLLKQALKELKKSKESVQRLEKEKYEPIAVIGMGCRLPGGVNSPEKLWQLLENGVDAITDMVDQRWSSDQVYDPNPEAVGKLYTKANGLVEDVDLFDAEFFGIAPVEARLMEPQQRFLLETTWDALEHAAIAPESLMGSKTGVYIGICHMGYSHMQAKYCGPEDISPYDGTGNAHSVAWPHQEGGGQSGWLALGHAADRARPEEPDLQHGHQVQPQSLQRPARLPHDRQLHQHRRRRRE